MAQQVNSSIVVNAPREEVFDYWHTLENLPNFMSNIDEVTAVAPGKTHWKVRGPLGTEMEFDAETTQDARPEALAWNTVNGNVQSSGQVRFREIGPDKTRLDITMNYADVPGGRVGEAAAKFVANPKVMMEQDLQNFKAIMEGEATPEEVQQRPSVADAQSGAVAFLTSGAGLILLGGGFLLFLLLRGRRKSRRTRIIFEF